MTKAQHDHGVLVIVDRQDLGKGVPINNPKGVTLGAMITGYIKASPLTSHIVIEATVARPVQDRNHSQASSARHVLNLWQCREKMLKIERKSDIMCAPSCGTYSEVPAAVSREDGKAVHVQRPQREQRYADGEHQEHRDAVRRHRLVALGVAVDAVVDDEAVGAVVE